MTPWFEVPPLEGDVVRLEPLSPGHVDDLAAAAEEDRGSYGFTLVPRADDVGGYVAAQLARTEQGLIPFAQVRRTDDRAVGCTGFWDPRYWPGHDRRGGADGLRAVEIGFTWLGASAQGTSVNAEAKLLLVGHAFETLGVERVDLKTDARNARCRGAMDALGLTFEGVLRQWSVSWAPGETGRLRDSAMYSVVTAEWSGTREHIRRLIAARNSA